MACPIYPSELNRNWYNGKSIIYSTVENIFTPPVLSAGLFHRHVPVILEMLKKGKMEPLVPIPTISMIQVHEEYAMWGKRDYGGKGLGSSMRKLGRCESSCLRLGVTYQCLFIGVSRPDQGGA